MKHAPQAPRPPPVTQDVAHGKRKERAPERRAHREGEIDVNSGFASGRMQAHRVGERLGWLWVKPSGQHTRARVDYSDLARIGIRSVGPVTIGLTPHVLGVCEGTPFFFLAREGRVWRVPHVRLPQPALALASMPDTERAQYADACARAFADAVQPQPERELHDEARARYHAIVRALVDERILDAAGVGIPRDRAYYAHGISPEWDELDLVYTRTPTLRHALLISLVLALPLEKAAPLIELGALLEHRIPVVDAAGARTIYTQGCTLLARLSSEWWGRGHLCDWHLVGDITHLFMAQYTRMLYKAWERDVPIEATAGARTPPHEPLVDPETEVWKGGLPPERNRTHGEE